MSLTSAGLTIKRLADIQTDLSEAMKAAFGASTNTDADAVMGQLIGVFAGELAPVYELAQQLYDSFDLTAISETVPAVLSDRDSNF